MDATHQSQKPKTPLIFLTEYLAVFKANMGHFILFFFSAGLKTFQLLYQIFILFFSFLTLKEIVSKIPHLISDQF
jgi:hypothetical protein